MTHRLALRARWSLPLSAASGLVLRDGIAVVIGDDRSALDRIALDDGRTLPGIALLGPDTDPVLGKAEKPDLEALVDIGGGELLALGSGSRRNRERGFRVSARGQVQAIDLAPLYARLRQEIPDLNIEGAARQGDTLLLAHRGVGHHHASRLIRIDASRLFEDASCNWPASVLVDIRTVALDTLDGVALAFTDLAVDEHGTLHYLAAAEATDDAYLDGECRGSVIGRIDDEGGAHTLARLDPDVKAEGLAWLSATPEGTRWLVVTDADDPARRATLYELDLPR